MAGLIQHVRGGRAALAARRAAPRPGQPGWEGGGGRGRSAVMAVTYCTSYTILQSNREIDKPVDVTYQRVHVNVTE